MKIFIIFCITLINFSYGSWKETHCSNSNASVKWRKGSHEDVIHLKYSHFIEGTLSLGLDKVRIDYSKDLTVSEHSHKHPRHLQRIQIHVGKVTITPSASFPDALSDYFPDNKIQTAVICSTFSHQDL